LNGILNVREVAKLLHIKPDTVRIKLRSGQIRGFKAKGSHLWLIAEEEVKRIVYDRWEEQTDAKSKVPAVR